MLRACGFKQAHGYYVCNSCRQKLPRTTAYPSSLSSNARSISTTSLRHSSGDNKGPVGGFGRGLAGASFGGFGVKPKPAIATDTSKKPDNDGLLPHEREARRKLASAPKPVPKPVQVPKEVSRGVQKAQQVPNNWGATPGPAKKGKRRLGAEEQANIDKSRSKLDEIFATAKRDQDGSQPQEGRKPQSSDALNSGGKPSVGTAPTGWGSFSSRVVTTNNTAAQRRTSGAPHKKQQPAPEPASDPPGKVQGKTLSGAEAWQAMATERRSSQKPRVSDRNGNDDFWSQMESRVTEYRDKLKEAPEDPIKAPRQVAEVVPPPRRKTRFEIADEREDRRERKVKQKNQKKSRERNRNAEYDDDDDYDWEAHERLQEEKRQRKLQEAAEAPPIAIFLPEFISVSSLAQSLSQKVDSFLNDLEEMGFENMTNDTILTGETAALIAMEYGFDPTVDNGSQRDLRPRPAPADVSALPPRPPIVTIMGHVDHGKTTLLDYLRKSSIAAQEHGGITQHIGAFVVKMSSGKPITFLDTPGHAAFLNMRQRGANVTDIVVLVVAADDSVKPQTLEALKHAQGAKVPIIVAINKVDKEEARVDQVKADLSRHGVEIEDFGGDVQVVCVSGKTGQGMEDLEENIITLSEMLDTRAEEDGMAEGWILESSIKQDGKAATVLVKRGTLRMGDFIAAGQSWARIRLLRNEAGVEIDEAPPGTPVEILGWRDLPEAGEMVLQAPDEDKAKTATEYRIEMAERQQSSEYLAEQEQRQREKEAAEQAAAEAAEQGLEPIEEVDTGPGIIYQNYVVRADVAGSVEAVCGSIMELGNNEVQTRILRSAAGQISESDIEHAAIAKSIIINFNLPIQPHIKALAQKAGVVISDQSVIYHVVDNVREALSALLPPKITHRALGEADVLQIFPINIKKRVYKNIAGCRIRNGSIKKTSRVKVLRRGKVIFDGAIDTLKHVKKDVMEMSKGSECGIGFDGFEELETDDQVQTYEIIEEKRTL